jgi:hypothetical protein
MDFFNDSWHEEVSGAGHPNISVSVAGGSAPTPTRVQLIFVALDTLTSEHLLYFGKERAEPEPI